MLLSQNTMRKKGFVRNVNNNITRSTKVLATLA
jgi:hypothetical protein